MNEQQFAHELQNYVKTHPKLVKARPVDKNLYILKYTNHVFYKGLWNHLLEECRGTVVDEDFNVVARPFTKIYNYGIDKESPIIDEDTMVTAIRKVNGFLVNVSFYQGDLLITTSGAADGPHVRMAKEYLESIKNSLFDLFRNTTMSNCTLMFECVHPDDPHIIREEEGLWMIGIRENRWYSKVMYNHTFLDVVCSWIGVKQPRQCNNVSLRELKEWTRHVNHEGYVFYTEDGQSAKLKSPYYLATKLFARLTKVEKLLDRGIEHRVPEEYYPLLENIRSFPNRFMEMSEQERIDYVQDFIYSYV